MSQYRFGGTRKTEKIMDISNDILTRHGESSGIAMEKRALKKEFLNELRKNRIYNISIKESDFLENENYHTDLKILFDEGMIRKPVNKKRRTF